MGSDWDGRETHANDVFCASLCGEHAEDTGSTANVQNGLALEKVGVLHYRIAVGSSTDAVL